MCVYVCACVCVCVCVCTKIVANIFEPQGIAYVDAQANFLSNDLLPLVEKTVTEKKVHATENKILHLCVSVLIFKMKVKLV